MQTKMLCVWTVVLEDMENTPFGVLVVGFGSIFTISEDGLFLTMFFI